MARQIFSNDQLARHRSLNVMRQRVRGFIDIEAAKEASSPTAHYQTIESQYRLCFPDPADSLPNPVWRLNLVHKEVA